MSLRLGLRVYVVLLVWARAVASFSAVKAPG
jgi:hypothetical protein